MIKSKNTGKKWNEMSVDEQARWLCLIQAVDVSSNFAEKRGINTDKSYKWIKPCAYSAYIKEMLPSMKLRLQQERDGAVFND
jgi:hypothetical protein